MGVEYLLSSLGRYFGSVAISSSSSSSRNMRVIPAMASFLNCRSDVVEEDSFGLKQMVWLEVEMMNQDWVKLWRVFVWKFSRILPFVE